MVLNYTITFGNNRGARPMIEGDGYMLDYIYPKTMQII